MDSVEFFKSYFSAVPIDRSDSKLEGLEIDLDNPIPETPSNWNKSLEEIVESRGEDISRIGGNIVLMWSGGIDSTLTFYSLVKYCKDLTIVYTENSLKEYPLLGKQLLSGEFKNVKMLQFKHYTNEMKKSSITVTGELGDQTVGSATFVKFSKEKRMAPYESIIPKELQEPFSTAVKSVLNRTDNITTGEYLWALNFIFKYTEVTTRIKQYSDLENCDVLHFFEADDFQLWALKNYRTNVSYDKYKDYKRAYKDYIFSQNGDKIYRDHKTKIPSLRRSTKD